MIIGRVVKVSVAALVVSASVSAQTTWYVDEDTCPGVGSGTEADPFCSIQNAITLAADGDEIVVAAGTYIQPINLVGKAITLRGSDGPASTVIDAQGIGSAVIGAGAAVLRGLTITGGSAADGGGMLNSSGSPVVIGCTFVNNSSSGRGGALFSDAGVTTLIDCVFITNVSQSGGAIRCEGGDAVIEGCTFIGNFADFNGGAILALHADLGLTDCILSGNEADVGGAIDATNGALRLNRCQFVGNLGTASGGAVFEADNQQFEMVNCNASHNSAAQGGGLLADSPGSHVVNCTFAGNLGHGVFLTSTLPDFTVDNCILWGNSPGPIGGAVQVATVSYCDVEGGWTGPGTNNIDADPAFVADLTGTWTGDPVYDPVTDLTVLTDANADLEPGALIGGKIIPDTSLDSIQTVVLTNTATTITLMGELWSAIVSEGETYLIRDDHLAPDSPCIDAGDNTAVPEDVTDDLDGNPRFLEIPETPDTGNGDAPIVDMGAYEALGGGCLAVTSLETVCHGEGSTFTVNVEGLNACTGGTTQATFTGAGGEVGADFCATLIINTESGGFCCSMQVCVPVPDCAPSPPPCDIDGAVGVTDFLDLLSMWGPCP